VPSAFLRAHGRVRRLFERFPDVELDYFRRTGIFPIMHTVVLRRDLHERHPWLSLSLYKAFVEAQRVAFSRLSGAPALPYALAWLEEYLAQERATLGADAWAHGVDPNRRVIETLVRYLVEQGIIASAVPVERLFAPSTLTEFRI
jgi:4,5-dihydroxyphthalate decarboxylase